LARPEFISERIQLNEAAEDAATRRQWAFQKRLLVNNKSYLMNIQTENGVRKEIIPIKSLRVRFGRELIPQADDFFRHIGPLHPGFRSIVTNIFFKGIPVKKVKNFIGNKPGTGRIHVPVGHPRLVISVGYIL